MAEENKRSLFPFIFPLIIFVIGISLGYYISYSREKRTDYKELLQETINYITTIEHNIQNLTEKNTALENENNTLKKGQKGSSGDNTQYSALNDRIQALERENISLRSQITQIQALSIENQQLKERIQTLLNEIESKKTGVLTRPSPIEPSSTGSGVR